jgi:pimeloyl-ACP methyl ester carboxylesterase
MGIGNESIQGKDDALGTIRNLAGLAVDDVGESDARPPLVLLHGLTFDRTMWQPALAELGHSDPGRRALAFDLPGHGESPAWESYDVESVAHGVYRAVEEAGLDEPVIVGHSLAAIIAGVYAGLYPTRGVVNVDQPLQTGAFAGFLQSIADQLRGPAFPAIWDQFAASMHVELLPATAQQLVRTTSNPRQDLVLGYWREVLERPVSELAELTSAGLAALRARNVPYLIVAGSELEPDYRQWLSEALPQAVITVLPGSGHFPHLAHPDRFAECLAATAQWTANAT